MNPGTVLAERFEVVRALARGGMADLFVGKDLESGAAVAIKVLREDLSKNVEAIARFHREAEIATRLVSPHVAKILEFGVTGKDWPYIVMELLDGHDLGVELRNRAPLAAGEAASYIAQACLALIEAHDAGIVHRDLKPSNLFLAQEGSRRQLKVLDFGIAKVATTKSEDITRATSIFGSPIYMSPEAFRTAKAADARSDIWSLGVILYEMLAAVPPFSGSDPLSVGLAVTREELVPLSRHAAGVPPLLQGIVTRTLMKDPQERYQTMRELLSAIEPFVPRAPLDTPTREHVVSTSSRPSAALDGAAAEIDDKATLLKMPSIPPPASRSSAPPAAGSSEPPATRSSAPPATRSSAPPSSGRAKLGATTDAMAVDRSAGAESEQEAALGPVAKPAIAWKLGRPERESDAPSPVLSSAPPPPPMVSLGAHAKLALMGGVLGVAALAGWLAFLGPEPAQSAAPPGSSPAVLATGDSDQLATTPPVPVVAATPRPPLSEDPVPLEDLPLAASPAATHPFVGVRPRRSGSAKPKRFNPTDI